MQKPLVSIAMTSSNDTILFVAFVLFIIRVLSFCFLIAVIIILKILQIIGKTVLYMEYAVIFSGIMLVLGIIVGQETDERRKFFGYNN